MRRTQIYLDEIQMSRLRSAARAGGRTVSEVVREAIEEKLTKPDDEDAFGKALHAASGIWADRDDLGMTDEYVRGLRENRRA